VWPEITQFIPTSINKPHITTISRETLQVGGPWTTRHRPMG